MNLRKEFEYIRKTFFPLWDRKRLWKVRCNPDLAPRGRYGTDTRTILIKFLTDDLDDLHSLLIHEVSHCAAAHHGKRWRERMAKARDRAISIGRKGLAKKLSKDLEMEGYVPTVSYICGTIQDCVVDLPKVLFNPLIRYIARDNGMTIKEFKKRFARNMKRFRSVFEETKNMLRMRRVAK